MRARPWVTCGRRRLADKLRSAKQRGLPVDRDRGSCAVRTCRTWAAPFPQQTSTANCGEPHLRASCREPQIPHTTSARRLALCQSHIAPQVPWTRLELVKPRLFSQRSPPSVALAHSRPILPRQQIAPAYQTSAPARRSPPVLASDFLYHVGLALPCRFSPLPPSLLASLLRCFTASLLHGHTRRPTLGGPSSRRIFVEPHSTPSSMGSVSR